MAKRAPAVLAAHDLSCAGRCALTVVIPVLSSSGLQCVPLPTAALSTHTGGFTNFAAQPLTDFMRGALAHWRTLGLRFGAVYSGYLADDLQAELVAEAVSWQRPNRPFVLVDPVLGDDGARYQGIGPDMPRRMRELCRHADLITPNLTEAALLTGLPLRAGLTSAGEAEAYLDALGGCDVALTGVPMRSGLCVNFVREKGGATRAIEYEPVPRGYPGAGDLFASVLLARRLRGESLLEGARFATKFASKVIKDTYDLDAEPRYGLVFEPSLSLLA